jgi:Zn-dependent protease
MNAFHLFTLAGIPVRATLGFLLLVAYYAYSLRWGGMPAIGGWLIAVVVSFLVHEFGHALVARRFKLAPEVYLHGWGGLCAHQRAKSDRDDALIIIAGPLAGLALAGVIAAVQWGMPRTIATSPFLHFFFESMWLINFWWSLVNLLPLFPLDGGQLFRLGLLRVVKPAKKAERIVHIVAIAIAAVGVVIAVLDKSLLLGILAAALAFQNIRFLGQGSPLEVRARSALVDQLLAGALTALAAHDPQEARRLAYQARAERNVADDQLQRALELLVVTSVALEDWGEALDWAKLANATPAIDEARVLSLASLGRHDEARHAANEAKLAPEVRERIARRTGRSLG